MKYFVITLCCIATLQAGERAHALDRLVPAVYPTIMEAMEDAVDGDRILVSAGTYNEHISFLGKKVELIGVDGSAGTILDGAGLFNCVIRIDTPGEGAVVSGFTIQNGFGTSCGFPLGLCGGGILITAGSPRVNQCVLVANSASRGGALHSEFAFPTVENCTFQGNYASQGGAVSIHGGFATVNQCQFLGNEAYGWGGGLSADFAELSMSSNHFESNQSESGGGFFITESIAIITGCTVSNNVAVDEGGGAVLDEFSTVQLSQSDFSSNSATTGGGLAVTHFCDAEVEDCNIVNNTASLDGGGVYSFESFAKYRRLRVLSNSCGNQGGGFYLRFFADPLLENCLVQYNFATVSGGGIACVEGVSAKIVHCTVDSNTTSGSGGGVRAEYLSYPEVINSILWRNNATRETAASAGDLAGISLVHVILQGADPDDPLVMQLDPELDDFGFPGECSAAIDEGTDQVADLPLEDLDGVSRPQGQRRDLGAFEVIGGTGHCFIRGDCDNDGEVNIADAFEALGYLFQGESIENCPGACDYDDDGWVTIADVIAVLVYQFQGGSPPAQPFPDPGPDNTDGQAQECWILGP